MESGNKNNRNADEIKNMNARRLEQFNSINDLLKQKNTDIHEGINKLMVKMNEISEENGFLTKQLKSVSQSISATEYLEVDDLIETIEGIEDHDIKVKIRKAICSSENSNNNSGINNNSKKSKKRGKKSKKSANKGKTIKTRVVKRGRPTGKKNSYKRIRRSQKEIEIEKSRKVIKK